MAARRAHNPEVEGSSPSPAIYFMKKLFRIFILFLSIFIYMSCETLDAMFETMTKSEGISNDEAISAFRSAMNIGAQSAAMQLGKEDAYFKNKALKILLPDEAAVIVDNLDKIPGGQRLLDDVILRINRSAEAAAHDVVPIFATAITEMTVQDGLEIVFGDKNACTKYLHEKTYDKLTALYTPKMNECLNKPMLMGVSANAAWAKLVHAYEFAAKPANAAAKLFGQEAPMPPVTSDLGRFTTEKALDGLFMKVEEEEAKIRKSPLDYADAIVQKVFSYVKAHR